MKKKKIKNLGISKKTISQLNHLSGGQESGFTTGCTDGCGIFGSLWNCTEQNCTKDCSNAHGGRTCYFKTKIKCN